MTPRRPGGRKEEEGDHSPWTRSPRCLTGCLEATVLLLMALQPAWQGERYSTLSSPHTGWNMVSAHAQFWRQVRGGLPAGQEAGEGRSPSEASWVSGLRPSRARGEPAASLQRPGLLSEPKPARREGSARPPTAVHCRGAKTLTTRRLPACLWCSGLTPALLYRLTSLQGRP